MSAQSKTPIKTETGALEETPSSGAEIDSFLQRVRTMTPAADGARGRLVFAMDATMSRQPTWDLALKLQGDMFQAVKKAGALDVQLVYFRGFGETRASKWVREPESLARLMATVACQGGFTQIRKVLLHVLREAKKAKINAVVYVGDCMEEEIDQLSHLAGQIGLLGVPVFLFQEGHDQKAERTFKEIARLTRGAYSHFDAGSARQLSQLLSAVAVYASGGRKALQKHRAETQSEAAQRLLEQLG